MIKKFKEWFVVPKWEIGEPTIEGDTISPNLLKGKSKFRKKIVDPLVSFYLNHWKWLWGISITIALGVFAIFRPPL